MSNVAIVPARGGSKRFPRKNKLFCGKSVVARRIEAARATGAFDAIDNDKITATPEASGANAPFRRPTELTDDQTPTLRDHLRRRHLQLFETTLGRLHRAFGQRNSIEQPV